MQKMAAMQMALQNTVQKLVPSSVQMLMQIFVQNTMQKHLQIFVQSLMQKVVQKKMAEMWKHLSNRAGKTAGRHFA